MLESSSLRRMPQCPSSIVWLRLVKLAPLLLHLHPHVPQLLLLNPWNRPETLGGQDPPSRLKPKACHALQPVAAVGAHGRPPRLAKAFFEVSAPCSCRHEGSKKFLNGKFEPHKLKGLVRALSQKSSGLCFPKLVQALHTEVVPGMFIYWLFKRKA